MLAVVLASATVAGCFNTRDEQMGMGSPDVLYQRASEALAGGNYEGAIRVYEALEARFPFSDGARQARLDLMYAYYRQGKKEEAIVQFRRALEIAPNLKDAKESLAVALGEKPDPAASGPPAPSGQAPLELGVPPASPTLGPAPLP